MERFRSRRFVAALLSRPVTIQPRSPGQKVTVDLGVILAGLLGRTHPADLRCSERMRVSTGGRRRGAGRGANSGAKLSTLPIMQVAARRSRW